jgi:hypothetical protein
MSQKDTSRVIFWRFAATTVLLLTAVAVTLTTYKFLINGEEEDFETAVSNRIVIAFHISKLSRRPSNIPHSKKVRPICPSPR